MKNSPYIRDGLSVWRAVVVEDKDIKAVNKTINNFLLQNYPGYRLLSNLISVRIVEVGDRKRTFRTETIKDNKGKKIVLYFDVSHYHKNRPHKKRRLFGKPAHFPQEDINACMDKKLDAALFKDYSRCPECKLPPEKLTWIEYTSPAWTWEALCGRKGPLSICPVCRIQVEIIVKVLN